MSVLGEYVARDLRTQLYEHLQKLSLSFFSRKKTGSLITRVSSDTDRLWDFLAFGVIDVSLSFVMLAGLGAVLIGLDWQLGLVMILPVPPIVWFIFSHGQKMERYFLRAWRRWSRLTDVLSDTIPGVRVVKAFNREQQETARFTGRNRDVTNEFNTIHRVWTRFWPVLTLAINAMTVAIWVLALPRLLGTTAPALSAGKFVSFLLYSGMFVGPIEVIGQMARVMNRATSSAHRIFEVLDTEPEVIDRPAPVRLEPVRGRITFDGVTFAYDGVRSVLKGVRFDIAPGEMIGLVGPSGGGKSTIANLVARFYDPVGGRVLVDGTDLRDVEQGHYRRQVGMVLQDPYLFHGSVVDNIRYGLPEATLDTVVEAAQAANAHDFICRLPHGYDTVVGERGHTLSGGERQRVSIARAILHDPRILILDEATSAVDTETERKIEEAMHRLIGGRTVLAIAHRLSTLRRADRLFVVEDGEITEQGTHAELLANPRVLTNACATCSESCSARSDDKEDAMTNSEDRLVELTSVPPPLTLRLGPDGSLRAQRGAERKVVRAVRCFPWSLPERYISLRDEDDAEVALVVSASELEPESRAALEAALAEAGFLFEVRRIVHVEEEVEIRTWVVETERGRRSFQTARDAWPQQLPSGDFLVRDVSGDLYRITQAARSDPKSRPFLFAFVE